MHYDFSMEMTNCGRMEARVLMLLERVQAELVAFSSMHMGGQVRVQGVIAMDEQHVERFKALAMKIEGVCSVQLQAHKPCPGVETLSQESSL